MEKKVFRIIGIGLLIVFLLVTIIIILVLGIGGIIVSSITASSLIIIFIYFSSLRTREINMKIIPFEKLEPSILRTLERPNGEALAIIAADLITTRAVVKNSIKHHYKMSFSKVRRMMAEGVKIGSTNAFSEFHSEF